jgi:hypothetical protein
MSAGFIADCQTREATKLRGPVTEVETSCPGIYDYADIIGDEANIDFTAGKDLTALVTEIAADGVTELNPIERFFTFRIPISSKGYDRVYEVADKDRFDPLCGCNIYYQSSPGASQ